jgi:Outer membrane protein beta-barrel domain
MRKNILAICLIAISSATYAQRGTFKIGIGGDLGIPHNGFLGHDSKTGFGGYLKGLMGISKASQITFTTGYLTFPGKESAAPDITTHSIFSLLPGFRYSFKGFYVEPQAGYSSIHSKSEPSSGFASNPSSYYNHSEFLWAVGLGYEIHNLEIGIRYQSAALWGSWSTKLLGIHLGYNFSVKRK